VAEHLLQVGAKQLQAADASLAPKINRDDLEQALAGVPDEFLMPLGSEDPARQRAAYVAYLRKRLHAPRPFVSAGKHVPFQFGR
jgi:predicted kinase